MFWVFQPITVSMSLKKPKTLLLETLLHIKKLLIDPLMEENSREFRRKLKRKINKNHYLLKFSHLSEYSRFNTAKKKQRMNKGSTNWKLMIRVWTVKKTKQEVLEKSEF